MSIRTGTMVTWKWGSSSVRGKVSEVHHDSVTRQTQGESVTRHGTEENPAYVIEQDDGTVVLKLRSEVERA